MRCSHGVPYEAKCTKCFAEAMAREILRPSLAHAGPSVVRAEYEHKVTFSSVARVGTYAASDGSGQTTKCLMVGLGATQ
jgi:hypothetical protein